MLYEVFNVDLPRLGPGDNESTRKAFSFLIDLPSNPYILDVGCGTGMQTLELARLTNGKILALDNHQPYLDKLEDQIKIHNLSYKIKTKYQSMFEMKFNTNTFDVIWSEGAAYIYGFEKALMDWQFFLKENGYLVFSELCWFKENIPEELDDFFKVYPAMKKVEENIKVIASQGLNLISYFKLPESSWWNNYYIPLEKRIDNLRKKYQNDEENLNLLDEFYSEIEIFRKYSDYYGYVFFIMKLR
ncbi:MAG: class I SAM-dependent methyltransferase [Promethearchaeota archaeon]